MIESPFNLGHRKIIRENGLFWYTKGNVFFVFVFFCFYKREKETFIMVWDAPSTEKIISAFLRLKYW